MNANHLAERLAGLLLAQQMMDDALTDQAASADKQDFALMRLRTEIDRAQKALDAFYSPILTESNIPPVLQAELADDRNALRLVKQVFDYADFDARR